MAVIELGNAITARDVHPRNALAPTAMDVMESGRFRATREEQPWNAH